MKIVVTVGSTQFHKLISIIDSEEFIIEAKKQGYDEIIAQIGKYNEEIKNLNVYAEYFKPSEMKKYFSEADLVIGHAGAGTIMEVLQLGKPLIVVYNDSLMENHQTELAEAMAKLNLLTMAGISNFLEIFKKGQFQPHKIILDCHEIVDSLANHFNLENLKEN